MFINLPTDLPMAGFFGIQKYFVSCKVYNRDLILVDLFRNIFVNTTTTKTFFTLFILIFMSFNL